MRLLAFGGLLWWGSGIRRRLSGPLLLLGALCLFYQTFSVAWSRLQGGKPLSPDETFAENSGVEKSLRFISALESVQARSMSDSGHKALVLTGRHVVTDTEVQLYVRVLQQMGYEVLLSGYAETSLLKHGMSGVSLLLCLSSSETSCLRRVPFSQLKSHQRVNLVPQIMKAFSDAGGGLCHMFTHASLTGSKIPMSLCSCASSQDKDSLRASGVNKAPVAVLSVYILITAVDPLISYMHDITVLSPNGEKARPIQWENLRPEDLGFATSYQDMMEHIHKIIADVLQAALVTYKKDHANRCLLCYQLLTFTLLFNPPLTPTVIQVDTDWTFSALDDKTFDRKITKDLMLEDMIHFLLKSESLLYSASKTASSRTGPLGVTLSEENQLLLLQFSRQMKLPGPFQLLDFNTTHCSSSVHPQTVHDFVIKTACYYEQHQNLRSTKAKSLAGIGRTQQRKGNAGCVDSRLRQIYTDPPLSIAPAFDPGVKEYRVEVPFDTVTVRIRPEPFDANCRVRLDELSGPSMANLPLGLGQSRIRALVTDGGESEAVVMVYTLNVFRESRPSLPMFGDHVMCSFTQECSLLVRPDQSCGLDPFNKSESVLQPCSSGDTPGRWVVPCLSCSDNRTCDWREIAWQPDNCYYPQVDRPQLQKCMADRKLLFIGDSTNRGMMYFLMERVNSSLQDWEKAHDTLVYTDLNGGRTLVSYSYYPQFWLEANQRPTFTESVDKLLERSRPLSDSRRTVLIVGGVQWLKINHLKAIKESLKRKGLSNILVVIKTLGMGFHLLVDGVRSLKLREIQDLYRENQNLISTAKEYGFEVVDTFSITMGRYKEFLQGRCACHFHEVKKRVSSKTSFVLTTQVNGTRASHNTAVTRDHGTGSCSYEVKGAVNQVYSEILLTRLCPAQT
ncbi:unnamed protein product [Knipowitschia caucasica]|uniref:Cadherin-like beta-sandwich-like domain-containing protein n=1 Tax=Knipowitschia caucasica TaxID=637954 RepID=A0AAV2ITE0_KNICA